MGGRTWTVEEENLLRSAAAVEREREPSKRGRVLRAVAHIIGRSYPAVRRKAFQLGEGTRSDDVEG